MLLFVVHIVHSTGAVGITTDLFSTKNMGHKVFPLKTGQIG
jgi:hypothetical protein